MFIGNFKSGSKNVTVTLQDMKRVGPDGKLVTLGTIDSPTQGIDQDRIRAEVAAILGR